MRCHGLFVTLNHNPSKFALTLFRSSATFDLSNTLCWAKLGHYLGLKIAQSRHGPEGQGNRYVFRTPVQCPAMKLQYLNIKYADFVGNVLGLISCFVILKYKKMCFVSVQSRNNLGRVSTQARQATELCLAWLVGTFLISYSMPPVIYIRFMRYWCRERWLHKRPVCSASKYQMCYLRSPCASFGFELIGLMRAHYFLMAGAARRRRSSLE